MKTITEENIEVAKEILLPIGFEYLWKCSFSYKFHTEDLEIFQNKNQIIIDFENVDLSLATVLRHVATEIGNLMFRQGQRKTKKEIKKLLKK